MSWRGMFLDSMIEGMKEGRHSDLAIKLWAIYLEHGDKDLWKEGMWQGHKEYLQLFKEFCQSLDEILKSEF